MGPLIQLGERQVKTVSSDKELETRIGPEAMTLFWICVAPNSPFVALSSLEPIDAQFLGREMAEQFAAAHLELLARGVWVYLEVAWNQTCVAAAYDPERAAAAVSEFGSIYGAAGLLSSQQRMKIVFDATNSPWPAPPQQQEEIGPKRRRRSRKRA